MEQLNLVQEDIAATARACGRDPASICLVVVSKGQSVEAMRALYELGVRDFGESRVQELLEKRALLPADISWHLIGTLQTKKANSVAGRVSLIHSVDTLRLAEKLPGGEVLIQVNTSGESTKHGFSIEACKLEFEKLLELPQITIKGLMTMAPRVYSEEAARASFRAAAELRAWLETQYGCKLPYLSMGMSQDYRIAIQEGATHLRLGSAIFT